MNKNETFSSADTVRLTQYSHGAGCGCKIAPSVLSEILSTNEQAPGFENLLVGNNSRDDAAVWDLKNGEALISTTDFFMPIVDDPFDFGRIAATNAISDVYAMGGRPVMAIAVLGWPVDKLPPEIAGRVISGGKKACADAGIPLAGGHSIDSPEPIFGLAVNGLVKTAHLKRNDTGKAGDVLFITKKLGIGILSTASKKGLISEGDLNLAVSSMTTLNTIGSDLGSMSGVTALTDVTGFGLLGHLTEMAEGSGLQAELYFNSVPVFEEIHHYLDKNCIPGGTNRNWNSYGKKVSPMNDRTRYILADPQTSGGLLVSVRPDAVESFQTLIKSAGLPDFVCVPIGKLTNQKSNYLITVIE
ncbi:MAG TPA: selenide, water dikinase SelD [Bacteroidia bacterium]|nr:selenide, water dikinase SelD [Bacteroidia bacterium]